MPLICKYLHTIVLNFNFRRHFSNFLKSYYDFIAKVIPSTCPIVSSIKHGTINPGICTGNFGNREVPDKTVCIFECNTGYKLTGRKSLTCHGTG